MGIPFVIFSALKHDLSITFQALEWRHREFTLLYNASCDSLIPKPANEIVKEVSKSERIRSSEIRKEKVIMYPY